MTKPHPHTAISRAARMHTLARRNALLEAMEHVNNALGALAEVEEVNGTRKALTVERDKLRAMLGEMPVYRPPERGQGENVDSEHLAKVREARAGEDTRGVEG